MDNQPLIPVILAGGKGERFWPLSRCHRPKQFLCLDGSGRSLLQSTTDRLLDFVGDWQHLWVITSALLADGVREQLPDLPKANLLIEPLGRDTAPAVAWASMEISRRLGNERVVGFFPADHWIGDWEKFQLTLAAATELAIARGAIATLGVAPTYPAIGYGYIEQGESLGIFRGIATYKVNRFTEKPTRDIAESFLCNGRFSWNSGIFVFQLRTILNELRIHTPDLMTQLELHGVSSYPSLPKVSIDYALMEKTSHACVIPASFGWDDLGDWNALERLLKEDSPNVELAKHLGLDTHGAILYASDKDELIVTIGLEDTVIVRDGKVTLIVRKDRTQEIKHILHGLHADPQYHHWL